MQLLKATPLICCTPQHATTARAGVRVGAIRAAATATMDGTRLDGCATVQAAVANVRSPRRADRHRAVAVWGDGHDLDPGSQRGIRLTDAATLAADRHLLMEDIALIVARMNLLVAQIDAQHPLRVSDVTGHAVSELYIGVTNAVKRSAVPGAGVTMDPNTWKSSTDNNSAVSRWYCTHAKAGRMGLVFVAAVTTASAPTGTSPSQWMSTLEAAVMTPAACGPPGPGGADALAARADGVAIASRAGGGATPAGANLTLLYVTWKLNPNFMLKNRKKATKALRLAKRTEKGVRGKPGATHEELCAATAYTTKMQQAANIAQKQVDDYHASSKKKLLRKRDAAARHAGAKITTAGGTGSGHRQQRAGAGEQAGAGAGAGEQAGAGAGAAGQAGMGTPVDGGSP